MKITIRMIRYALAVSLSSTALLACHPPEQPATAAPVAETRNIENPSPVAKTPVYRSARRISSDCGVVRAPLPFPGLAPVAHAEVGEMGERTANSLAIGADRPMVETDLDRVAPGYTVVSPVTIKEKFIIDNNNVVVGGFEGDYFAGHTEILENGDRFGASSAYHDRFRGGGRNGCAERYAADGTLLWRVSMSDENYLGHHDVALLENGNFLAIVWDQVSTDEAVSQGRNPDNVSESGEFWYGGVIEVNPYTMEVVWEWSVRHHLVQDFDPAQRNYGVVAEQPELIDINRFERNQRDGSVNADWTHFNSIDYNPELDQILLSSPTMSEIWIIDHSTTPWESMGHTGGRHGKGGDLLYRWGNPQNYHRGSADDRRLFGQHDAQWVRPGLPGAGNVMVFNNGDYDVRPYTTIVEFTPPMAAVGSYIAKQGQAYGPTELRWEYNPEPPARFFSWFISGAQRLPNGNTLINHGAAGKLREVTVTGDIVWEYEYTGVHDVPYMFFRANKYPPDHPGILQHLYEAD
jgi:hypothetical protein